MSVEGWKPLTCISCGKAFMKAASLQAHQSEQHGAPDAKAAMRREQDEKALRSFVDRLTEMAYETGFAFAFGTLEGPTGSDIHKVVKWVGARYTIEELEP